ncbi:MAG: helix-turn-helix domain-containing protein, partial [Psychroflexus sp.]
KSRKRNVVQARQIAMYFAKEITKTSLTNIGRHIGQRDHSTVLHSCKIVSNLQESDKQFRKFIQDLEIKFKQL